MLLTLSIKNHQGKASHSSEEYNFGNEGGSIGRDNNNEWVLPDQNNFLSKKHALIQFHDGCFYITDTSTNGVFINYSRTPLGRGNQHKISTADEIIMGEYTLVVSQLDESVNTEETPPLSSQEKLDTSTPAEKLRFTLENKQKSTNFDPFDELFTQKKEAMDSPNTPDDNRKPEQSKDPQSSPDPFDSIFTQQKKNEQPENASVLNKNQPDLLIKKTNAASMSIPDSLSKNIAQEKLTTTKKREVEEQNEKVIPSIAKSISEEQIPATPPSPQQQEEINEEEISRNSEMITDADALTHILLGAGFTIEEINKIQPNTETYQIIGQILKESLDGTMNLLRSRNAAKNHLHLDNTLISRHKNNPLKFLPNAHLVLKQTLLLNKNDATYLTLTDALREAYADISAHEYSMATSIQKALATTIKKHFAPSSLQRKLEKDSPISSKIPLKREADLWQLFTSIYEEVAEEASESFQVLLDKEIVNAYELQIKHLKEKR